MASFGLCRAFLWLSGSCHFAFCVARFWPGHSSWRSPSCSCDTWFSFVYFCSWQVGFSASPVLQAASVSNAVPPGCFWSSRAVFSPFEWTVEAHCHFENMQQRIYDSAVSTSKANRPAVALPLMILLGFPVSAQASQIASGFPDSSLWADVSFGGFSFLGQAVSVECLGQLRSQLSWLLYKPSVLSVPYAGSFWRLFPVFRDRPCITPNQSSIMDCLSVWGHM